MADTRGGLLDQYRLLGSVIDAEWATRLDHKVARHVIDRYYPKHGNGRASLRYLEQATGGGRPNIIASLRRLCENGVFTVVRQGKGTRPTEYALNFSFPPSGIVDDTTTVDCPSGNVGDTSCGIVGDTVSAFSGNAGDTESVLRNRPTAELQEDGNSNAHAAPTAPPASGLSAAAPGPARDPESAFDRFWRASPRKYQKPKARAAWAKLNPDVELCERIIAAAGAWAAHYAEQGTEKKWMPAPANWLAGERYDEDLPVVYADPKEAAVTQKKNKSKKSAASPATPDVDEEHRAQAGTQSRKTTGAPRAWAFQPAPAAAAKTRLVEVDDWTLDPVGADRWARMHLVISGTEGEHAGEYDILWEASDSGLQEAGQKHFDNFIRTLGVDEDIEGVAFLLTPDGQFLPDPANEKAMEHPNWYAMANQLALLSARSGKPREFRNAQSAFIPEIVAELERLAANDNHQKQRQAA